MKKEFETLHFSIRLLKWHSFLNYLQMPIATLASVPEPLWRSSNRQLEKKNRCNPPFSRKAKHKKKAKMMNTTEKALTETEKLTTTTKNNATTNTKQVFVRNKEIEKVFTEYQKARQTFATKIADLSRFPRNIQDLEEGGAMNILRALLLDSIPSIQQSAALALGRLANYSPELASGIFFDSLSNSLFLELFTNSFDNFFFF